MDDTATRRPGKIRVVCVSDTHGHAQGEGFALPPGDVLVHAGDITNQGTLKEFQAAARWLRLSNYTVKIIIAGNHDLSLDPKYTLKHAIGWTVAPTDLEECRQLMRDIPGVTYLEHESVELKIKGRRLRVFGSPYSVDNARQNWAFQYSPEDADKLWQQIPTDIDILITHTPAKNILDASKHWNRGSESLLQHLGRVKPLLHCFGHHHEGRGACSIDWTTDEITSWKDPGAGNKKQSLYDLTQLRPGSTAFVNASIMKHSWSAVGTKEFNKPIVVDLSVESFACD